MTPSEKHAANEGRTESLPDALRDMLLGGDLPRPAKAPVHKNGRPAPHVGARPLSAKQKGILSQIAADAFAIQSRLGLVDPGVKLDAWRHAEAIAAVKCRISEAEQRHYLPLKGHFQSLAGKTGVRTLKALVAPADDPDRQAAAQALRTELARFAQIPDKDGRPMGDHRAEAYLLACAKHKGTVQPATVATIRETWPVAKIWALVYTLRNRIAAKLGVGYPSDRNKSQRRAR